MSRSYCDVPLGGYVDRAPAVVRNAARYCKRETLCKGRSTSSYRTFRHRAAQRLRPVRSSNSIQTPRLTGKICSTYNYSGSWIRQSNSTIDFQELERLRILISKLVNKICSQAEETSVEVNAYEQFRMWRAHQARMRRDALETANILLRVRKRLNRHCGCMR